MATFVLVPGSFAGGWVWQHLAHYLRAAGHDVYTPTPTGMGERVHLAHPDTDLETWIADVSNVLFYEDLEHVILVGWSSGGMLTTGVADRLPSRIALLVYVNGFVPLDGQSHVDLYPPGWAELVEEERAQVHAAGGFCFNPPNDEYLRDYIADDALRAWYCAKVTPQPFKTALQPVRLSNTNLSQIRRVYLYCAEKPYAATVPLAARMREWFREEPTWTFRDVPLTHFAPFEQPAELASLLVEVATSRPPDG
jgi:pimeloyl-ACP methyl ester carboxylesterase